MTAEFIQTGWIKCFKHFPNPIVFAVICGGKKEKANIFENDMKSFPRWLLVQIPLSSPQTTVRIISQDQKVIKQHFGKLNRGSPCLLQVFVLKVDGPESWFKVCFKQPVFFCSSSYPLKWMNLIARYQCWVAANARCQRAEEAQISCFLIWLLNAAFTCYKNAWKICDEEMTLLHIMFSHYLKTKKNPKHFLKRKFPKPWNNDI